MGAGKPPKGQDRALAEAMRRHAAALVDVLPEVQDLGLDEKRLLEDGEALEVLSKDAALLKSATIQMARVDPNTFIEYVSGMRQHAIHRYIQAVLSKYPRVSIDAPVEHGKTTQTDVMRVSWELGNNQGLMVALVSNSTRIPHRAVAALRAMFRDERYLEVFPHVEVEKENTEEIYLKGRTQMHPSILGIGVEGAIIGSRVSLLILDDILDFANTFSENERRKMFDILTSTVLNRVLANGRVWDIGTPWHVEDARHQLRRLPGFVHVRFDATDGTAVQVGRVRVPIEGHKEGDTLWPEIVTDDQGNEFGWPMSRLDEKRRTMPGLEFDRQFRCMASAGSLAVFRPDAIQRALDLGRGLVMPGTALPGEIIVSGVDLAFSRKQVADETVIFTGTARKTPNGYKMLPLDIRAGRWELSDIVTQLRYVLDMFSGHSGFRIESNAGQAYLLQLLGDTRALEGMGWRSRHLSRLTVVPHLTTVDYKMDPVVGVRSMSADFENGRWILPSNRDGVPSVEVQRFIDGLVAFDPLSHTSDYVMAAWMFTEQVRRYIGGDDDTWTRFGIL